MIFLMKTTNYQGSWLDSARHNAPLFGKHKQEIFILAFNGVK